MSTAAPTWVGNVCTEASGARTSYGSIRNTSTGDAYARGDDVMMLDATLCRIWDLPVDQYGRAIVLRWVPDPPRPGEPNALRCVHLLSDVRAEHNVLLDKVCKRIAVRAVVRQVIDLEGGHTREADGRHAIEAHDGCWQCFLTQRAASYICRGTMEGDVRHDFVETTVLIDNVTRHTCGLATGEAAAKRRRETAEAPTPTPVVMPTSDRALAEVQQLRSSITIDGERRDAMLRRELWDLRTALTECVGRLATAPAPVTTSTPPSTSNAYGTGSLVGMMHPSRYGTCLAKLLVSPSEFERSIK